MATIKSTRIRRAVTELAKFYGLSGAINDAEYIKLSDQRISHLVDAFFHHGETFPSVWSTIPLGEPIAPSPEGGPAGLVTKDFIGRIIITPYDSTATAAVIGDAPDKGAAQRSVWSYFNGGFTFVHGQGWRKPANEKYPEVRGDLLPSDLREMYDKAKKEDASITETQVHVVQCFDPTYTPTATDVDIATLLMNGISTLEWSRCVPYLDLAILDASAFKGAPGGGDALTRLLAPGSSMRHASYEGEISQTSLDSSVAGTMELFTSPQTMLTGNPLAIAMQGGKPFAPLLSIIEFETQSSGITTQGKSNVVAGAPAKEFTANLRLLLHDRARLNEIIGYFRPGAMDSGSASILITYGWAHPDGLVMGRYGNDEGLVIGDILNNCRTASVFKCKDVNYSFTDSGEVQLEVELVISGTDTLFNNAKLLQGASASSSDLSAVLQDTIDFVELMQGTAGSSTKLGLGSGFVNSLKDELQTDPDIERKLKEFKKKIRGTSNFRRRRKVLVGYRAQIQTEELRRAHDFYHADPTLGQEEFTGHGVFQRMGPDRQFNQEQLIKDHGNLADDFSHLDGRLGFIDWNTMEVDKVVNIEKMYESKSLVDARMDQYKDLSGIFQALFKKGNVKNLSQAVSKSNAKNLIKSLMKQVSTGHDPFLRPRPAEFGSKIKSCYTYDEFESKSTKSSAGQKNDWVSLGKLISFFITPTLQKMENVAEHQIIFHPFNYDAAGLWNHNIAALPVPVKDFEKKLTEIVKEKGNLSLSDFLAFTFDTYVSDNTMKHSEAFGLKGVQDKNMTDRLKALYGDRTTHKKATPDLRIPSVKFRISEKPVRYYLGEAQISQRTAAVRSGGRRVVRLEIYDEACSANPFQRDVQETNGAAMLKKVREEDRSRYPQILFVGDDVYANDGQAGTNRHKYYYDAAVEHFKKKKLLTEKGSDEDAMKAFVEKINSRPGIKDSDKLDKTEFESLIQSYYYLADANAYSSPELASAAFASWDPQEGGLNGQVRTELRKTSQGYIMYGNEGTAIMKCVIQTSQDEAAKSLLLLDTREEGQAKEDDKAGIGRLPVVVVPGELDLEILGNPFVQVGQEFYVHLGTHTNIDGIYTVTAVEHHVEPGEYMTSVKLKPPSQIAPRYVNAQRELFNFIAQELGADLK